MMFIRVKYGDDETLLCNPYCAIVNLLTNIKARTGHAQHPITIDLTDETGLIQELDTHRYDCAAKYLAAPGTYVLVKKQAMAVATPAGDAQNDDEDDVEQEGGSSRPRSGTTPAADDEQYEYIPLLNNWRQLLPGYRIQQLSAAAAAAAAGDSGAPGGPQGRRKAATAAATAKRSTGQKFDSPAGMKTSKTTGRPSTKDRAPSRRK